MCFNMAPWETASTRVEIPITVEVCLLIINVQFIVMMSEASHFINKWENAKISKTK